MTILQNIDVDRPAPLRPVPKAAGMLEHFPKAPELDKALTAFEKAEAGAETERLRGLIAKDLKHMRKAYHPSLPELLGVVRGHAKSLSDTWLEWMLSACEVAFYGALSDSDHDKDRDSTMLEVAAHALAFLMRLLKRGLKQHHDVFADLHERYFHFAQCAAACVQHAGKSEHDQKLVARVHRAFAGYVLLGRMDFFSLPQGMQTDVLKALKPIYSDCSTYFVPAGETVDASEGFWLEWEKKRQPGRPKLRRPLAGSSPADRLVTFIDPLIRVLDGSGSKSKADKVMMMQSQSWSLPVRKHVHKKLKLAKRRGERAADRENIRLLLAWNDVVGLKKDTGGAAALSDIDAHGFQATVEESDTGVPNVDEIIALDREGKDVRRARVIWKRVHDRHTALGCTWLGGGFTAVTLSMLGHSEIKIGVQEWMGLIKPIDEKRVRCWMGDPALQAGLTVLLPLGNKSFSATLDEIEYRGGNFCQVILLIREEWKEPKLELDI